MIRQPGEHIAEPGPRIDVVELGSLDQGDVVGQQRRLDAPESLQSSCCCDALTLGLLLSAICEGDHTSLAVPELQSKGHRFMNGAGPWPI